MANIYKKGNLLISSGMVYEGNSLIAKSEEGKITFYGYPVTKSKEEIVSFVDSANKAKEDSF